MNPNAALPAPAFPGGIDALGTVVAEVELADGTTGVGVSIGGEPACFIIEVGPRWR